MSAFLFIEVVLVIAVLSTVAYWGANTFFKARASRALMETSMLYQQVSDDTRMTILVLGDSTGVGVGASSPEETVPGLLAHYLGATYVENYSVVGAGVEDLPPQIAQAKLAKYDVILIMIGGNNILSFDNVRWAGRVLGEAFAELPKADKTYLMSAGNAGGATIFPIIVRPFHTRTNKLFHREFERVAHAWSATYINLYEQPDRDPFLIYPEKYLAADGLHPSSEGYRLWFERLKEAIDEKP